MTDCANVSMMHIRLFTLVDPALRYYLILSKSTTTQCLDRGCTWFSRCAAYTQTTHLRCHSIISRPYDVLEFVDQVLRPAILKLVSSSQFLRVYPNTTYVIHQLLHWLPIQLVLPSLLRTMTTTSPSLPARYLNGARRIVLDSATIASSWLGLLGIKVYLYTGT